jgi:carbamoyl-phosphate synthase large subunit
MGIKKHGNTEVEMKRILVSGAGGPAGNNFIQSLRQAKEKMYIVGTDSSPYYAKLSSADKTYVVPPCTDKDYLVSLKAICDRCEIGFAHAQPDTEVAIFASNKLLKGVRTFLPRELTVDIAQDKYEFSNHMQENNVPCPETDLILNETVLFQTLLPKRKMWIRACKGAGSLAALPVSDYNQAFYWIEYWKNRGLDWKDFIISEYLPGKEYAFQSLWKDGQLITSAARERIEYLFGSRMPSGQSSSPTVAKSVHNDLVNSVAVAAIKALDRKANGIFCVDMKCDAFGVPHVTEINAGRFFTTSLFFTMAGANMPYQYVKLGYGEEVKAKQFNAVPEGLYWIRQIDCVQKMVTEDELFNSLRNSSN